MDGHRRVRRACLGATRRCSLYGGCAAVVTRRRWPSPRWTGRTRRRTCAAASAAGGLESCGVVRSRAEQHGHICSPSAHRKPVNRTSAPTGQQAQTGTSQKTATKKQQDKTKQKQHKSLAVAARDGARGVPRGEEVERRLAAHLVRVPGDGSYNVMPCRARPRAVVGSRRQCSDPAWTVSRPCDRTPPRRRREAHAGHSCGREREV